ncbi:DUF2189 domain-containing protein [Aromatoleum sp.]|uniref:DUF2189 domain-containing protein n=1 Tax=Aromatoleum sp. TaxID=2307007 RepID=UPI002FC60276
MARSRPVPTYIPPAQVFASIVDGARLFARAPVPSMAFSATFAIIGIVLLTTVIRLGFAPMTVPLIGGFMLVAPSLLAGFFAIARAVREGRRPGFRDITRGFRNTSRDLWGLLLVCGFLFVIWITDAGILYSFMVGGRDASGALFPLSGIVLRYQFGAAVAGGFFALIVFCVTVYAVPLIIDRRENLVVAVNASVRAVFRSFIANALWAVLLGAVVIASVIIPLLLTVTLPIAAYATESLYRAVFPAEGGAAKQ